MASVHAASVSVYTEPAQHSTVPSPLADTIGMQAVVDYLRV